MRIITSITFFIVVTYLSITFAGVSVAEIIDYRSYLFNRTPDTFNVDLDAQLTNSVFKFSKMNNILWEANDIKDYNMYDGNISAVLEGNTVFLSNNACGGIVVPEDSWRISYIDDFLVATTPFEHHLYYVPDCAKYTVIENYGLTATISTEAESSSRVLCEIGYKYRGMRDYIDGSLVFFDDTTSLATVGIGERCYFMNSDGTLDVTGYGSSANEALIELGMVLGEDLYYATHFYNGDSVGFSGYTPNRIFNVIIYPSGAVETYFTDLPDSGLCTSAEMSDNQLCIENYSKNVAAKLITAERVSVGSDVVTALEDNILRVYDAAKQWGIEGTLAYSTPNGCVVDDQLYFTDYSRTAYTVKDGGRTLSDIPEGCDFASIYYIDGVFYDENDLIVYKYADIVQVKNGKKLLKSSGDDDVTFTVEVF